MQNQPLPKPQKPQGGTPIPPVPNPAAPSKSPSQPTLAQNVRPGPPQMQPRQAVPPQVSQSPQPNPMNQRPPVAPTVQRAPQTTSPQGGQLQPLQPGRPPQPIQPTQPGRPPQVAQPPKAQPQITSQVPRQPLASAPSPLTSVPAASSENQKKTTQPVFAKKGFKFPQWALFAIGGFLVLMILIVAGVSLFRGAQNSQITNTQTTNSTGTNNSGTRQPVGSQTVLTYWGLWEPTEVMTDVLKDFETQNPGIKVEYINQSYRDYRERLQTAIASQSGPDLFKFHASWVPMLSEELDRMPTSVMTSASYRQDFFPIAAEQLTLNGSIVGVPLMYDGLALYYNTEIFNQANVQPPDTWVQLKALASQLTVRTDNGIQRGGLAIGNASNVEHFGDILGLLILQNGGNPADPTSKEVEEALKFYTNFITIDDVWSDTLPNSTVAFARGEAAMMLAPSWRAHEVLDINPTLKFEVVPVPKLGTDRITWASYWAEGVNNKSSDKAQAWQLIKYLSSPEVMQKLYDSQSAVRRFGQIYSRVDLAQTLLSDPIVGGFVEDADKAQNWYLNTFTHDSGLNDQMLKYYKDAINAVLDGTTTSGVITTLDQGTAQVLRQCNVSAE